MVSGEHRLSSVQNPPMRVARRSFPPLQGPATAKSTLPILPRCSVARVLCRIALAGHRRLLGRCRAARLEARRRHLAALLSALVRRRVACRLALARPTGALATAIILVHRSPGSPFCLLLRHATRLV